MKKLLIILLMLVALPANSRAAWWLSQLHISTQQERISDDPLTFRLGDM